MLGWGLLLLLGRRLLLIDRIPFNVQSVSVVLVVLPTEQEAELVVVLLFLSRHLLELRAVPGDEVGQSVDDVADFIGGRRRRLATVRCHVLRYGGKVRKLYL